MLFFGLNLLALLICYFVSTMLAEIYIFDIRLIQPLVALCLQFALVPAYRKVMPSKGS